MENCIPANRGGLRPAHGLPSEERERFLVTTYWSEFTTIVMIR